MKNNNSNDIDTISTPAFKDLTKLIYQGNLDKIKSLIDANPDLLNQPDFLGRTILHYAAQESKFQVVKYLITKEGVDINKADTNGKTALALALQYSDNIHLATLLLSEVNKDAMMQIVKDPILSLAMQNLMRQLISDENLDKIKGLIDANPNLLNQPDECSGEILLHDAAWKGNIAVVKYLIDEKGVDINQVNKQGHTALSSAAVSGHVEVVKYLIDQKGVDVNHSAKYGGATVLYQAKCNGRIDVVNLITYYKKLHDLTAKEPSIDKPIEDSFTFRRKNGETETLVTADIFKKLLLQKYPESSLFHEYFNNLQILQTSTNESSSFEVKESVEKFYEIACKFKEESEFKLYHIDYLLKPDEGDFALTFALTFNVIKQASGDLFDIIEILEKLQNGEDLELQERKLLEEFKKKLKIDSDSKLFDEKGLISSEIIIEHFTEGTYLKTPAEKETIEFFINNPEYRVGGSLLKTLIEEYKDQLLEAINFDKDLKDNILELKNYILPLEIKKFIEELEQKDSMGKAESSSEGFEFETAKGDNEDFNKVERKHTEGEERVESNTGDVFESHRIEPNNVVVTGDIGDSGTEG